MDPEPIFLDFILDTPVKAEELIKHDITIRIDRDYKYTRVGCIDIYTEFCLEVEQLREFMRTHYRNYKPDFFTVDLLATQILADDVSGITFEITIVGSEYFVSTTLHDHSLDKLLKTRLEQRENLYDNIKRDTNTSSDVKFYLAELEKIDKSILHLHKQNSIKQLSKL